MNISSQSITPLTATRLQYLHGLVMEKMENLPSIWNEDQNQRRIPLSTAVIQEKASFFKDF